MEGVEMMRLPACLRVKLFPDNCAPVPTYRQGSEGVEDWLVDLGVDRETVQRIIERLDNILRAEIMEDEEEEPIDLRPPLETEEPSEDVFGEKFEIPAFLRKIH